MARFIDEDRLTPEKGGGVGSSRLAQSLVHRCGSS